MIDTGIELKNPEWNGFFSKLIKWIQRFGEINEQWTRFPPRLELSRNGLFQMKNLTFERPRIKTFVLITW